MSEVEPTWKRLRLIAPISPEGLRSGTDTDKDFPVPVIRIAKTLDIEVVEADLESYGYFDVTLDPAHIVVSSQIWPVQQRFTIARELGHVCLGHGHVARDSSSNHDWLIEREANIFAARLLMPAPKVLELYGLRMSLKDMAAYLQVSVEAMGDRLRDLDLV